MNGTLYMRFYNGLFLRCLDKKEATDVLIEIHKGYCGDKDTFGHTSLEILSNMLKSGINVKDSLPHSTSQ